MGKWYIQHDPPSTSHDVPEPQSVRDAYDALLALQAVEAQAEAEIQ
jgi:hypothetical protein